MDTTTHPTTPPEPSPSVSTGPALGQIDSSVWRLLLAICVTVVAMLIAAEAGVLLAAFGLASLPLGLAVVLVVAGILVRRQAMLPLSLVAAALTLPAAATALRQHPLHRSAGLLTVTPTADTEIDGKVFHRGAGTVFLDLRHVTTWTKPTISVDGRADAGAVVVALPRDRCLNVQVRAELRPGLRSSTRTALQLVGRGALVQQSIYPMDLGAFLHRPTDPIGDSPGVGQTVLVAYGRTVTTPSGVATYRRTVKVAAPTVKLHLVASQPIVVRDYPDTVGPLTAGESFGPQVGDVNWPNTVRLPPRPDATDWRNRWLPVWSADQVRRGVPGLWTRWERTTIAAQHRQAARFAGACASQALLKSTWVTAHYRELDPDGLRPDGTPTYAGVPAQRDRYGSFVPPANLNGYLISVNGLGTVEYSEYPANGGPTTVSRTRPSHSTGGK